MLLNLHRYPIFDQLQLEEVLLRTDKRNWCLINIGSPPAVVMGRTQKPEEVVDFDEIQRQHLPLIRRFSGGGCVVIDEKTLFFTLILNEATAQCPLFPQAILSWCHTLIAPAFLPNTLLLQGHDFAFNEKKVGGNAQTIIRNRFLHHISFPWTWEEERMKTLLHPQKEPDYRQKRSHTDFLDQLARYFDSPEVLIARLINTLSVSFNLEPVEDIEQLYLKSIDHAPIHTVIETPLS